MSYVLVGKVEGQPDQYYCERKQGALMLEEWTPDFSSAIFFQDIKDALGSFDRIRRSMEIHLGCDLKTGTPILNPMTKQPITRIDLPYHVFKLLGLTIVPGKPKKLEGKGTIFICTVNVEPTEYFIDVEGKHPRSE